MSIFSDYKVGALSETEFHNACVEMNARDRWEKEQEQEDLQMDFGYDDYEEGEEEA